MSILIEFGGVQLGEYAENPLVRASLQSLRGKRSAIIEVLTLLSNVDFSPDTVDDIVSFLWPDYPYQSWERTWCVTLMESRDSRVFCQRGKDVLRFFSSCSIWASNQFEKYWYHHLKDLILNFSNGKKNGLDYFENSWNYHEFLKTSNVIFMHILLAFWDEHVIFGNQLKKIWIYKFRFSLKSRVLIQI